MQDMHRISFRTTGASVPAVDRSAGIIRRVSLIAGNREATGHGVWIDQATIGGLNMLLRDRPLKAYVTHARGDGTLTEVGIWTNASIDCVKLVADFTALDAWKKHNPAAYDTLFELAEKMPGEFGVSISVGYKLAWVLRGGETSTVQSYSGVGWQYTPPAPVGALREIPSVRPFALYSADFVDQPAANEGLFSAGRSGAPNVRTVAQCRAELASVIGSDAEAARLRGKLVAEIKGATGKTTGVTVAALREELAAITGCDAESAKRRGELAAQIRRLR